MSLIQTGHAEIDHQHQLLDSMLDELNVLCAVAPIAEPTNCQACGERQIRKCKAHLGALLSRLADFLEGHALYEERMMELLPDSRECQAHVRAHKLAHQVVGKRLEHLGEVVASQEPLLVSKDIWSVINTWLGDHSRSFDRRLVIMAQESNPEINYDSELVAMLDEHVFHKRPTMATRAKSDQSRRPSDGSSKSQLSKKQIQVLQGILAGKTNVEIAGMLNLSINTVKTHRAVIYQKLNIHSTLELIRLLG